MPGIERVSVVTEARFVYDPAGDWWCEPSSRFEAWAPYLASFPQVQLVGRARRGSPGKGMVRLRGEGVTLRPLPDYSGAAGLLRAWPSVREALTEVLESPSAIVFRVPSTSLDVIFPRLKAWGRPFGVHVVGDPWDVFGPGAVQHPMRPIVRLRSRRALRRQCTSATTAIYVTQSTLQKRYPPGPQTEVAAVTDCALGSESFLPLRTTSSSAPFTVVAVGSLEVAYKGIDTLLDAVALLSDARSTLNCRVVGAGRLLPMLERKAKDLGLAQQVTFTGCLNPEDVRREYARADVFVMPSRAEGLPRALVEAMAAGLPCLATPVGGIPELLDREQLFPVNDAAALTRALSALLGDPTRMKRLGLGNQARARDLVGSIDDAGFSSIMEVLHNETLGWLRART